MEGLRIPVFNENGLCKYQRILSSKHNNLKQTVTELMRQLPSGIHAGEIAKKLDLAANSSNEAKRLWLETFHLKGKADFFVMVLTI